MFNLVENASQMNEMKFENIMHGWIKGSWARERLGIFLKSPVEMVTMMTENV